MAPHPSSLADLARRCKSQGLRALSRYEKRALRVLCAKEMRKRAFQPQASRPRKVLAEFCDHVIRSFDASAAPVVVIDNQPYFRRIARRLSKQDVPLASLILYAAWIEHWVNMMVTVAMLRGGNVPSVPLAFLKTQPKFKEKLVKLASAVGINELPKKLRDALLEVVKLRNRYLHFGWEGLPLRQVRNDLKTLGAVVKRCERLLDKAQAFEHQHFDAPYSQLVSRVFRVR